jgi:hypothetical protein
MGRAQGGAHPPGIAPKVGQRITQESVEAIQRLKADIREGERGWQMLPADAMNITMQSPVMTITSSASPSTSYSASAVLNK